MGSGTSRSSLTRDECKQLVAEDKWDESWDEFYFAEGKSVSSELAERVWCKAERWAAHIAASAVAEPKDDDESPQESAQPSASDEATDATDALAAKYPRLRGGEPLPDIKALDFSAIIADKRGQHLAGTREWVFDAVEKWRVDPDAAKLFWLVDAPRLPRHEFERQRAPRGRPKTSRRGSAEFKECRGRQAHRP